MTSIELEYNSVVLENVPAASITEDVKISARNTGKSHTFEIPHVPLASAGAGQGIVHGAARLTRAVNEVHRLAGPLALVVDVAHTGYAAYEDYEHGTTRNTVETVATIAGGTLGGHAGAVGGAALGTLILPGVGTIIGAVVGAVGGGLSAALATNYTVDTIGDSYNYDIIEDKCRRCGKKFKYRRYRGKQNYKLCDDCYKQFGRDFL